MSNAVVLIGLSGSGKSTVGRHLASRLALPLLDTDRMIEEETGRTVADIFATAGEARFRELEAHAVTTACSRAAIVSVGGGAVLAAANRQAMRRRNLVVWLDLPVGVLVRRLAGHSTGEERPLLTGDLAARLFELSARRRCLYAQTAHIRLGGESEHSCASHALAHQLVDVYTNWHMGGIGP